MTFNASKYVNFVSADTAARERLTLQYMGPRDDFDLIVIGSGMGGGVLADDLAERLGRHQRILVLEAGSFLYPTHVYNFCRFPNASVAKHFGCDTFWQDSNSSDADQFIGEKPQLNFGGRSIFWSGLIPTLQGWELDFFPHRVRQDLVSGLLNRAGEVMNESRSLGAAAEAVVTRLRASSLAADFSIQQTPRALHQPYLEPNGIPKDEFFTEPTGVFNTAELLVNQLGLSPGVSHGDGSGLHILLRHFVEDIQNHGGHMEVVARNLATGDIRTLKAGRVILAAGSIESPKLLRRSSLFPNLPNEVKWLVGRGLTDHPTTDGTHTFVDGIGDVNLDPTDHAKIVFYSRGLRDGNRIRYPFNVEMNLNHERWHLRDNDPSESVPPSPEGLARIDIKFSFGNCLDDDNLIEPAPPFEYVPKINFHNQKKADRLAHSRLPALANWHGGTNQIWDILNDVTHRIFSQFRVHGQSARPADEAWYGQNWKGFGYGTVHHAAGSLRMPSRPAVDQPFSPHSVVDEDLRVIGADRLYVCDMSVMPISTAANPVRTLVGLALRLSQHLG
ncbi:GMC oxidoreductase [Bremerella sp. JC817]|uniref:GMC oxidoreductase n=1 Tax=Bremerella sp. JC817 TaxID=3231756 RepID=UPI003457BE92